MNRIVNKKGRRPGATLSWWTGLRALNVENGLVAFVDMDREEGNGSLWGGGGALGVGFHGNCNANITSFHGHFKYIETL